MTWSYALAGSAAKDQVRLLIGDTLSTDPQLQDEEIAAFIAQRVSLYGAAAECCRSLASKFSRSVTFKAGQSSANFSDLSKAYLRMATEFDQRAAMTGAATPYAGGISQIDKRNQEGDADRVAPQFNIGLDDNLIEPFGPAANETESDTQPGQE